MTWYYDPVGQTLDVYDHTGALVAEGVPFPGAWSGIPDRVYQVIHAEARSATERDERWYAWVATSDLAAGNVVEGTP